MDLLEAKSFIEKCSKVNHFITYMDDNCLWDTVDNIIISTTPMLMLVRLKDSNHDVNTGFKLSNDELKLALSYYDADLFKSKMHMITSKYIRVCKKSKSKADMHIIKVYSVKMLYVWFIVVACLMLLCLVFALILI